VDINNKLHNFLKIIGIVNNMFKQKKTRIKLYNMLTVSVLLCSSENWTIKARDTSRVTVAEMKYMRRTVGYTQADH
jgi:hypothetical protein